MKILWFTWKDKKNPCSGGAELVNEEMARRLVLDGNEVIFITAGFKGGRKQEVINGYKVIRLGNKWTVYWLAYRFYKNHLSGWADLVIDEVNTVPFFCKFFVKEKNIILCYQLCRQIWFYQMFFPLSLIGYLIEPLYLIMLNDRFVLTESESTKTDLQKYGFKKDKVFVFNIGLDLAPIDNLTAVEKFSDPTVLILGSLRSMKRPLHVIKAFELARQKLINLKLKIAGDASSWYGRKALRVMSLSRFKDDIDYEGRVSFERKKELMQRCHLICVTSTKEGWGIIVNEANSQGTPAVVYNVDGLRDAVRQNTNGLLCEKNTPQELALNIVKILSDKNEYNKLREQAWQDSKFYTHLNSYQRFLNGFNFILAHL